jgi:hypothetical protein
MRFAEKIKRRLDRRSTKEPNQSAADKAVKWTAWATVAIAILTLAIVFVGIAQFLIFRKQLNEMQATTRVIDGQLKEMQADKRPWLDFDVKVVQPMTFDKRFAQLSIEIDVRNTGHSPAVEVMPLPKLLPVRVYRPGIDKPPHVYGKPAGGVPDVCPGIPSTPSAEHGGFGQTIFAEGTGRLGSIVSLPRAEFSEEGAYSLELAVCIPYAFTAYAGRGRTIRRYWVTYSRPMGISTRMTPIAAKDIILKPLFGTYAE